MAPSSFSCFIAALCFRAVCAGGKPFAEMEFLQLHISNFFDILPYFFLEINYHYSTGESYGMHVP